MLKALPRIWLDFTIKDLIATFLQLISININRLSDHVIEFENLFADYIGTKNAISFPSARAGMFFTLKALNFQKDDEIILPAFAFYVDAEMVVLAGLKPIFIDIDLDTGNIDLDMIEQKINSKTKAIFITHLNSIPVNMDKIVKIAQKYNLRILEDCARACGVEHNNRKVGSFDIGFFSFGSGKNFYLYNGGMVTSSDNELTTKLQNIKKTFNNQSILQLYLQILKGLCLKILYTPIIFRFTLFPLTKQYHINKIKKYETLFKFKMFEYTLNSIPNFKIKMNSIQATRGIIQLTKIDKRNQQRSKNVNILKTELKNEQGVTILGSKLNKSNTIFYCAIYTNRKTKLQKYLLENKIDVNDESACNTSTLKRFIKYKNSSCKNADILNNNILFIPVHPNLSKNDLIYIASKIKNFFLIENKCNALTQPV